MSTTRTLKSLEKQVTHALANRTVSVTEARRLVSAAKQGGVSTAERKVLQGLIDDWGDRFQPAAEKVLGKVAKKNHGIDTVTDGLKAGLANGSLNQHDMEKLKHALQKDRFTPAERRELDRLISPHLPQLTAGAKDVYAHFRVTRDAKTPNPFNQKFPTRPGDFGNRARNEHATGKDKSRFPIFPNTPMVDGLGHPRGTVERSYVRLNFGQRKMINGEPHVYAFASKVNGRGASGWVPEKALKNAPLTSMATIDTPKPLHGDAGKYTITGGKKNQFGDLKVRPNIPRKERVAAGDYMKRPGGVVNMLFNLPGQGGVSNDTVKTGATFVRAAGVKAVKVPLYQPESKTRAGSMTFVYGRIGDRYGWIARDTLKKA